MNAPIEIVIAKAGPMTGKRLSESFLVSRVVAGVSVLETCAVLDMPVEGNFEKRYGALRRI